MVTGPLGPGHTCTGVRFGVEIRRQRAWCRSSEITSVWSHIQTGQTPTLAENKKKMDCGAYGTENRRGQ